MVKKIKNETKKNKSAKNKKQARQQQTKQQQIQAQQSNVVTNEFDKNEVITVTTKDSVSNEVEYESEVDIENFIDNVDVIENDVETEDDESFSYVDEWCSNDFDTSEDDDVNLIEESIYNKIDWLIDLHQQDVFEPNDETELFDEYIEDDQHSEISSKNEIDQLQNHKNTIINQQQNVMELLNCKVSSEVPTITNNVIQKLKEFNDKINNMVFDDTNNNKSEATTQSNDMFSSSQLPTTLNVIKEYRNVNIEQIIGDVDLDEERKIYIIQIFQQLGWIDDVAHAIFVAVLHQEWDIAYKMMEWCSNQSITLRKIFGNWERLRDKRKVKEFCIALMKYDEKSMPTLNEWAKQYALKHCNRIIKSYCDLCVSQDCKAFIMQYSQDL
jgi:hypothetical protein